MTGPAGAARALWHRLEPINAVTYFSPECREAPAALGLKGFWMGYFACRSAPMGRVGPGVVEATFFNFHPDRVRRAIPDAWEIADPPEVLAARSSAAATALRRLLPDGDADRLAAAVAGDLDAAIDAGDGAGRPLFAANREVELPADPVEALWQQVTTLREHRGDGHVALLAAAGLDGCEVHVLFVAGDVERGRLHRESRGWTDDEWHAAIDRLAARGLVTDAGGLTADGHSLRDGIEARTDELASVPFARAGVTERLLDALGPAAATVEAAGDIAYPNPMGLPSRGDS